MEDLTCDAHVDRLPVIISGIGVEQLLGVPKISSGTGKVQATAVISLLENWGVTDQVAALCFNTTASNTGHHSGACFIIGAGFKVTGGNFSIGPDIQLFKRFKEQWSFIDHDNFKPASSDSLVDTIVAAFHKTSLTLPTFI